MASFSTSTVLADYLSSLAGGYPVHKGALMLSGYLHAPKSPPHPDGGTWTPQEIDAERYRLYIEDSFRIYYEFARGDLLHQIPGGKEPAQPMDAVWIRREAPMQRVELDYAFVLAETDFDYSMGGPRPPHSGPRPPHSGPRPPFS